MIAYKVVHAQTRMGTNAGLFLQGNKRDYVLARLINQYSLEKFFPLYHDGAAVEEAPNSVGLLCFSEKRHAEGFLYDENIDDRQFVILKVDGSDLRADEFQLKPFCGNDPRVLVEYSNCTRQPPTGTIRFRKLTVIGEDK